MILRLLFSSFSFFIMALYLSLNIGVAHAQRYYHEYPEYHNQQRYVEPEARQRYVEPETLRRYGEPEDRYIQERRMREDREYQEFQEYKRSRRHPVSPVRTGKTCVTTRGSCSVSYAPIGSGCRCFIPFVGNKAGTIRY